MTVAEYKKLSYNDHSNLIFENRKHMIEILSDVNSTSETKAASLAWVNGLPFDKCERVYYSSIHNIVQFLKRHLGMNMDDITDCLLGRRYL